VFLVWNGKHFAALKRVNRARSTDKGSALLQNWRREMFETEMTIQYELGEQGIAPSVHAVIMDDQNCMYAIMDVMNGGNLEEYVAGKVAQGSWSENELQDIVFKLAIKLHAMHEMGYAHRDFKLSNTMLNHNTMEPFISDFGETTTISNLVQSSCNRGEFGVQPPERGIELFKLLPKDQRRMDAYSFGLAMAHMYAGKRVMAELVIIDTTVGKFNYNRPLDVSKEPWFVALQNVNAKLAIQSLLNQNFMLRWTMKQLLLSDYLKDAVKRGLANESQRRQLWASKNKDKDSSDHRGKK
jgi:serine/threonine protein kinase